MYYTLGMDSFAVVVKNRLNIDFPGWLGGSALGQKWFKTYLDTGLTSQMFAVHATNTWIDAHPPPGILFAKRTDVDASLTRSAGQRYSLVAHHALRKNIREALREKLSEYNCTLLILLFQTKNLIIIVTTNRSRSVWYSGQRIL